MFVMLFVGRLFTTDNDNQQISSRRRFESKQSIALGICKDVLIDSTKLSTPMSSNEVMHTNYFIEQLS